MFRALPLQLISGFLLFLFLTGGTNTSLLAQNKKVIFLKDKKNSTYTFSSPEGYLSKRAIDRRKKYNIPIDSSDLPVNSGYINMIGSLENVRILGKSKWMNALIIDCGDPGTMNQIAGYPFVRSYSNIALRKKDNKKNKSQIENVINENIFTGRRLNNGRDRYAYGSSYEQITIHNGQLLHNIGAEGQNMMIAFFDSGFKGFNANRFLDSASLNNQIIATKDIVNDDTPVNEDDAHGLYCLSVVAANRSGELVGSCPKAQFLLLRTEDVESEQLIEEYFWAIGAEYADSCGADVFSSSVGYTTFDDPAQDHIYPHLNGNTTIVTNAADKAAQKGIFVVTSAGNEGGSIWKYIGAPADGDSVYAVGAVGLQKNIAGFSSSGPTYDGRIKPDGLSVGLGTYLINTTGSIVTANGTSFSTPNLAGLITCLWQLFPDINNATLMQAIKRSSDRYNAPLAQYGYGIPDMAKALSFLLKQSTQFSGAITDCRATLNWRSYDTKGMGYLIQRKFTNEANFYSIDTVYSTHSSWEKRDYTFTDIAINKNASYRIFQLLDTSHTMPLSFLLDSVHFFLPESCKRNDITLYPNPAKSFFKIEVAFAHAIKNLQMVMYNAVGQQIKFMRYMKPEGYFTTPDISTSGMSKGLYVIKIYDDNEELSSQKLIIK
jgi:serine protease AprX